MGFKIKKILKTISGIVLIISGWLALGIGFTIKSNYNSIIFYSGFVLIIIGIIVLVIKTKTNSTVKRKYHR